MFMCLFLNTVSDTVSVYPIAIGFQTSVAAVTLILTMDTSAGLLTAKTGTCWTFSNREGCEDQLETSSGWWFQTFFYVSFHKWDVILPIDELHHFSRWLLHHQPDH